MAKGQISIDERFCKGCAYCVHFCPKGCLAISGDRFTPQGYLLPVFVKPDLCNACGICGWMCPHSALEVYKIIKSNNNKEG